jgi:hypothetical protein
VLVALSVLTRLLQAARATPRPPEPPGADPAPAPARMSPVQVPPVHMPPVQPSEEAAGMAMLATLVGAVVLARLSSDPALSEAILLAARRHTLAG